MDRNLVFRTLGATLISSVAALLTVGSGPATAGPLYPLPDPDPIYATPSDIAEKSPGEVIATRAMPPLITFPGSTVTLVKFRSTNSRGLPIAATTTVLTPQWRAPDGPLLSYQHVINGLGTQCAVSRELYTTDPNLQIREAVALNAALARGWSVALPDHLGPTSAYGAARLGGQITLDGIRAARAVPDLGLRASPVAMAGYSGGGMATAWAAALAPRYAPELKIAGAATGGVPMNLVRMIEGIGTNPHPAFGLVMAAGIGLEREYPDRFPLSESMNARGLAARESVSNGCTNDILAVGAGRSVTEFANSMRLVTDADARAVVEENSLELFDGVPEMPIFEWHSATDPLIPVDAILNTNRRYCAAGVRLQSEQLLSPEHMTTAVLGIPAVVTWLDARFRGDPAPSNC
ncbi:lipase [Nocardia sp. NEAU-351]|uniref:Lipase n=1 Tax=Nocardia bovistercoris TaxID=2785916 RepID=A0A931II12_9NOCA|nr:lipase [Nocardia bovistercoris]